MKVLIILSLVLVVVTDKPYYCSLEPVFGDCKGSIPLWSYSEKTKTCKGFLYSGCGGNPNRFFNEDQCIDVCINGFD